MEHQPSWELTQLRTLVVGGGGIGAITALNLTLGGKAHVTMVLRSNHQAVLKHGYQIESVDHGMLKNWRPDQILAKVPSTSKNDNGNFDYVVCTTKNIMDSSPSTLELLRPAITPSLTKIVLIQNGLNVEVPFISSFPKNVVLSGISYMGSHESSHGVIQQSYADKLEIGVFKNNNVDPSSAKRAAQDFVDRYGAAGRTDVSLVQDVTISRWTKLLYNATVNPTSAILRMNTGDLHLSGAVESIALPAMVELRKVAASKGVDIGDTALNNFINMSSSDALFEPSMFVDAAKGNLIEYESILGEPVREALSLNIPVPFLTVLYSLCHSIQWQIRQNRMERASETKKQQSD